MYVHQSRFTAADDFTVNISDSWIKGTGGDAILIDSPGRVSISNNHIYGANFYNSGSAGIELSGRVIGATLTGNILCGGDWLQDIQHSMYGIKILPNGDYITVTGNVFSGDRNTTGLNHNGCSVGFSNGSSGSHIAATGNTGP